jgi:hypothetical protein
MLSHNKYCLVVNVQGNNLFYTYCAFRTDMNKNIDNVEYKASKNT